ncbi:MAG: hypothetical protein J0I88_09410 [Chryseobacterium sp.]|uniref:Uncharacterized protein n=1 Tax=Epilithonimonas pallida TaxID=373671 RepID=A0ABY1R379_9FLAO|nr:hypothetical protein [Epilithonimonas pallida]MBN9338046.1 hypothetical protein [Chryseobacterium sp.]OJX31608.1 MAG: hypothetical protein BGO86_06835 [Chryseobacterium sp. 36-9]SMP93252.1 hypothetical protein SAMN05421679_104356 [Epilithonimonas pallida]
MKRLIFLFVLTTTSFTTNLFKAQVNVNININSQPEWGPRGYNYVESYYLPEYDIYYNVPKRRYYYFSGNRWLYSTALPVRYRHINLYQTHKIVLVDRYPFKKHKIHYKQYARYRNNPHGLIVSNYGHHYKSKPIKDKHYNFAKVGPPSKKSFHQKNHFRQNKHHKGGPNKHK